MAFYEVKQLIEDVMMITLMVSTTILGIACSTALILTMIGAVRWH